MKLLRYFRLLLAGLVLCLGIGGVSSSAAWANEFAADTPTADFIDNNDGTVTHKLTGLTWKRCAEGQTWIASTCSGTVLTYTWADATALTQSYAGNSDWRLPTVAEQLTIIERDNSNPAVNITIFPSIPLSTNFWTASATSGSSTSAWSVRFEGLAYAYLKTNLFAARLVRGGSPVDSSSLYTPTSDFTDNGDGTVTHNKTNLTWKRCAEGQTWNNACTGTPQTYTWVNATALTQNYAGQSDWRLPTNNELLTIVEWSTTAPAINQTIFPANFPASEISYYWSASAYSAPSITNAWTVYFSTGMNYAKPLATKFPVRLVRGVRSTIAIFTGMSLSCPTTLLSSASGSCSATAIYSDGTTNTVSPTWSSSNAALLNVGSDGSLTAGAPSADTVVTINASYSENGVSKTATAAVTVKSTATVALTNLSATCPSTITAGTSAVCSTTASYSDGSSNVVSATWTSSNTSVATVSGLTVTANAGVTTDTPVSLNASYSENGVSKTATVVVTVKAFVPAALTGLTATCPSTIDAGTSADCSTTATYNDGSSRVVNAAWTSSNTSVATVSGSTVTADAGITADTPVLLSASYSENGVNKTATATVTVKAAPPACSGNARNHSDITIVGSTTKQLGETLEVNYCLKNFNSASKFDIYVAVQLPDNTMMYLQTSGFFQTPNFTTRVAPYLSNTLVPDKSGPVLSTVLPQTLPIGIYNFYAVSVLAGKDVNNSSNWIGSLNKKQVELIN
ncbi:MAG: DUF1566 domain-containing protein [Sulfuricellaceae bacterium]